ncbi:hypothetical protein Misp01_52640 [Microtetraspora sp. NBRC 13810]|nr:hypothetical protein Misp01_52640 [Microtetraspora sp. NBRC 13810]
MAALTVVTLGLTGCADEQTGRKPLSQDEYDRALRYAQCMEKHGIEVPIPNPSGGPPLGGARTADPHDPKQAAGRAACERLAPPIMADREPPQELVEHALRMAECLRERGIDAKDPRPGKVELSVEERPGDTPEKLRAAFTVCGEEFPAPRE